MTFANWKIKLIKISDNPNDLRDNTIDGETDKRATVGASFFLAGPPRDIDSGIRIVGTRIVVKILSDTPDKQVFRTENSTYCAEYLT